MGPFHDTRVWAEPVTVRARETRTEGRATAAQALRALICETVEWYRSNLSQSTRRQRLVRYPARDSNPYGFAATHFADERVYHFRQPGRAARCRAAIHALRCAHDESDGMLASREDRSIIHTRSAASIRRPTVRSY